MKRFVLFLLALFAVQALAQIAPIPAPDPGTPVTTMRSGYLYINNVFPKARIGVDHDMLDTSAGDSGSSLPGRWPGYAPDTVDATLGAGRNGGAFRVFSARSHFAYDDPIVFPGQKGRSHLHVFFGNTKTSGTSTPLSIRTVGNSTSAGGTLNRSAYWVPAMIYVCDTPGKIAGTGVAGGKTCDPRRNGEVIDPLFTSGLNIYYKGYFGVGDWDAGTLTTSSWGILHDNEPFPVGFRMIAGDSTRTTEPTASDLGFTCTVTDENEPFTHYIPGTGISDSASAAAFAVCHGVGRMTMRVPFPSCRNNAGDLDSPAHNAHIVFKEQDSRPGAATGDFRCPTGFDHPVPGVTYHLHYAWVEDDVPFYRLASDHYSTNLPAGYSTHGDWFNGWDQDTMDEWVNNCDVLGTDCHDGVLGPVLPEGTPSGTRRWRILRPPKYGQGS